jgi:hypothetical protein
MYDGRLIQFNNTASLPAPPYEILYEHFKQAVLANMRGAGEVPLLNYDPDEDSQGMDVFEEGTGKLFFETFLRGRLPIDMDEDDDQCMIRRCELTGVS